ncbi:hypothetical protein [Micromonospora maris]|uniref:hypothetical protein n=1 Tax=Micromonospora maris TaxID=1003110 RepID=UPI002E148CA2|nr:hypothetical protein OG712_14685 [Micromonospora maris]
MDDPERPSERLVEQRLRNRAMEALVALSKGDSGVRSVGVGDYINLFFDVIDDDFIASGWPGRIQPAARAASDVMQARGRFREDAEEENPSE